MNYQRELDNIISTLEKNSEVPRLFLHSCCAPCSSYVLEYLSQYFNITVIYYNPNITNSEEYSKRISELRRLIVELPLKHPVTLIEGDYEPQCFFQAVKGLEKEAEGGARCAKCFRLRLEKTAEIAESIWKRQKDQTKCFLSTTLTISPLKNADLLNDILLEVTEDKPWLLPLPSDFKKREGYKRSIELSRLYSLYRQNYCGCIYSQIK